MAGKKRRKKMAEDSSTSNKSYPNDEASLPAKKDEGEGVGEIWQLDRISSLPDCILSSSILSRLPIKDCARTSILSSRWRNLWSISPLHIDARSLRRETLTTKNKKKKKKMQPNKDSHWCIKVINKILSCHRGPIHSFRLSHPICYHLGISRRRRGLLHVHFDKWDRFNRTLNRWIETLDRRGIQHLRLYHKIPSLALACRSLRSLELKGGDLTEPSLTMPPNLRELRLKGAYLTEISLSRILSSCPFLDTLVLEGCLNIGIMRIRSPCLRRLTLNSFILGFTAVLIEDVPNLEQLVLDRYFTVARPLKIFNAPKLWRLGVVNAYTGTCRYEETYYETYYQGEMPISLSTRVHSLKELTIKVNLHDALHVKTLAGFLRCLPCLETLTVVKDDWDASDLVSSEYWKQEGSSDCLDCHLKYVKIKGFSGNCYDLAFAKFLVKNAQALTVISLLCFDSYLTEIKEKTRLHGLGMKNRASLEAQVIFKNYNEDDDLSTWGSLFD